MKILSIGDTHGINVVDEVKLELENYDKIIFMGDYVDSFNVSNEDIIHNLRKIIKLKKDFSDKIILLLGNHDLQYLFDYKKHGCSGYRSEMKQDLQNIFESNKNLFQVSFQYKNYIWTHAGITEGWFKYRFKGDRNTNISNQLNKENWHTIDSLFDVGHKRGGYRDVGGPFWCDMSELSSSPLKDFNQIVGHTQVSDITKKIIKGSTIFFIDVLQSKSIKQPTFHSIEIN